MLSKILILLSRRKHDMTLLTYHPRVLRHYNQSSLSCQTRYEACHIMPCLLSYYKQRHPRGSITFSSTSISHMILKHCGGLWWEQERGCSQHPYGSASHSLNKPLSSTPKSLVLFLKDSLRKSCGLRKNKETESQRQREKNVMRE